MIRIEKHVPVPRRWQKYPWAIMEVGDSFFLPIGKECKDPIRNRVLVAGRKVYGKGCITSRSVKGGLRFWRIR